MKTETKLFITIKNEETGNFSQTESVALPFRHCDLWFQFSKILK